MRSAARQAKLRKHAAAMRTQTIPDLPASWPYEPRLPLPPLCSPMEVDLPGLGGGWLLVAPEGLRLPGEAVPLGGAFGRGGVARAGDVVLRPYRRGGLLRRVNPRLYASPRRFEKELCVHRALWEAGFPTVEPLGCAWRRRPAGCEGVYLSRFVPGRPWPGAWTEDPEVLPALALALRSLARWGLRAPDLNATNVHLGEDGRLRCLDWDRAAFVAPSEALLDLYLRRMEASLRRLEAPAQILPALARALALPGG